MPRNNETRFPEILDSMSELYTATNKPNEVAKWKVERAKYPVPVENRTLPREVE